MPQPKSDLSRSLVALEQEKTVVAVVELSLATWLVGGVVPGIKREPLKKLVPDQEALLTLLHRWRDEAIAAGHEIARMVVAYEAGRDGFWLARWLRVRGIEAYVIHPAMQQARCGLPVLLHGAKRDRERRLERLGGGSGDRLRCRLRERPAHQLDRLARDVAEAGSQAPRML